MICSSAKVFSQLVGRWWIERKVQHRFPAEEVYEVSGSGTFTIKDSDSLQYHEAVTMSQKERGLVFESTQDYRYLYNGETLVKCFGDGRPMYTLVFEKDTAFGHHLCDNDSYSAHYVFHLPTEFSLTYVVKGPRKDYTLVSHYRKTHE